ncbi:hypothetical protein Ddye_023968 [Dipteronia dyeriana]|uniref:HAT C-terminal dimerisation domain-containing protein n=1 Tax=Dipteronia dyeriana TaxID=168575 RepID=A0AAD9TUW3_9ROSI|nr:hypothetical protein Ddye_023968 [Dipteronia dyeriana]
MIVIEIENVNTPSNIDTPYYERDPGLRLPIEVYPAEKCDDVRKAYIKMSPCQPILDKYPSSPNETLQNRLRLKTSLEAVKWLAMQGCAFRRHDESINSTNRGNFIEMIKLQVKVNQEIVEIVLENSQQNAKYTSPRIQQELLNILANRVRAKIREEVRDAKFCILVDEAVDESNKEQMAIILRLQLALVAVAKEVHDIWLFFSKLNSIINFVSASSKRHSELKSIREGEIQELTDLGELETVLGISNMLFQALQLKSQDILNAMNLVSTTKMLPQKLRENEWDTFLESVVSFCERLDVLGCPEFHNLASLSELCQCLAETKRSEHYTLIDKLIRLVLTLHVSKTTTERAFSAMKLVKTSLRNKMDDDFLTDCMVIYIEREIADIIDLDSIMDEFDDVKPRKTKLK